VVLSLERADTDESPARADTAVDGYLVARLRTDRAFERYFALAGPGAGHRTDRRRGADGEHQRLTRRNLLDLLAFLADDTVEEFHVHLEGFVGRGERPKDS